MQKEQDVLHTKQICPHALTSTQQHQPVNVRKHHHTHTQLAGGFVHHAFEGLVAVWVDGQVQEGHEVGHILPLHEGELLDHAEVDALAGQLLLQLLAPATPVRIGTQLLTS